MPSAPAIPERPGAPLYPDRLGERAVAVDPTSGELVERLLLEHDLSAVPSFEFALRERTARLADFRPASYARVHRIERMASQPMRLAVVSDHIEGTRLSDLLRVAHERRLDIDISTWLCLIQQLLPAVALLHEHAPDVANGLIAPERIILTPHARLFVVEHVLGGAIEQLQYRRERLWRELRIAVPPGRGPARLDHRADMTSVGLVALALVLGRPLQSDEFPDRVSTLLHEARERTALGYERPLSQPLRDWITRALQLEQGAGFASAAEARDTFEGIVAADSLYIPAQIALEVFLARCTPARHDRPAIDPFPSAPLSPAVSQPAPAITRQSQSERTAGVSPVYDDTSMAPQPGEPDWEGAARQPSIVATSLDISAILSASDQPSPDGALTFLDQPPELIEVVATDSPYVLPQSPAVAARRRALAAGRSALAACWRALAAWCRALAGWWNPTALNRPHVLRGAALAAVAVLVLLSAAAFLTRLPRTEAAAAASPAAGTLVVDSIPRGLQVLVDGVDKGRTPARLSTPPGEHMLEVRGRGEPRIVQVNVASGAETSQHFEFAPVPATGELHVESQPAGATVVIDGRSRGVAPLTVTALPPGDHEVILRTTAGSARHMVRVQAGAATTFSAPVATSPKVVAPAWGWLSVNVPFPVEIRAGGRRLGTSDSDRIRMTAGRHEVQLVNDDLGYRTGRVVQVLPGRLVTLTVDLPRGTMNINALPWAEVWIDGKRIGETPLGNVSVPVGRHEVVFRHPQLGEKRQTVAVTPGAPVRVSVDMK